MEGPIPDLFVTGSRVPDGAPVLLEGLIESVHGGLVVTAGVLAPFEGECRRCLGLARGRLRADVVELITDEPDPDTGYVIEGGTLDLLTVAHDACILELPLAPLCREDCAGLCPECGVNLNLEKCSCTLPADPRLAVLGQLFEEMTGESRPGSGSHEPRPDIRESVHASSEEEDLQGQEP